MSYQKSNVLKQCDVTATNGHFIVLSLPIFAQRLFLIHSQCQIVLIERITWHCLGHETSGSSCLGTWTGTSPIPRWSCRGQQFKGGINTTEGKRGSFTDQVGLGKNACT